MLIPCYSGESQLTVATINITENGLASVHNEEGGAGAPKPAIPSFFIFALQVGTNRT